MLFFCVVLTFGEKKGIPLEKISVAKWGIHTKMLRKKGNPAKPDWYLTIFTRKRELNIETQDEWWSVKICAFLNLFLVLRSRGYKITDLSSKTGDVNEKEEGNEQKEGLGNLDGGDDDSNFSFRRVSTASTVSSRSSTTSVQQEEDDDNNLEDEKEDVNQALNKEMDDIDNEEEEEQPQPTPIISPSKSSKRGSVEVPLPFMINNNSPSQGVSGLKKVQVNDSNRQQDQAPNSRGIRRGTTASVVTQTKQEIGETRHLRSKSDGTRKKKRSSSHTNEEDSDESGSEEEEEEDDEMKHPRGDAPQLSRVERTVSQRMTLDDFVAGEGGGRRNKKKDGNVGRRNSTEQQDKETMDTTNHELQAIRQFFFEIFISQKLEIFVCCKYFLNCRGVEREKWMIKRHENTISRDHAFFKVSF